ncbi:MAG: hypothetical protein EBU84_19960 [Actinobacteria bacterium]|nr:hypothetical protein [Actinomycetota bacterium]
MTMKERKVYTENTIQSAVKDTTLSDKEQDNEIIYGEIVDSGEQSGEIVINNPVRLSHSMSGAEKTRRAMALKLAGASYAQIAQQLGYHDASGARKAVQRGMKNSLHETASELKKIHYGRLEHMLMLLWPEVNQRDLSSMSAALAVMDRMERLYGLNEAQKLDVGTGRETVILADGDKDSYIKALEEAGKRLSGAVSSSIPEGEDEDDIDESITSANTSAGSTDATDTAL